jgi:hypothetical protein
LAKTFERGRPDVLTIRVFSDSGSEAGFIKKCNAAVRARMNRFGVLQKFGIELRNVEMRKRVIAKWTSERRMRIEATIGMTANATQMETMGTGKRNTGKFTDGERFTIRVTDGKEIVIERHWSGFVNSLY